jgi:hypothetical protein
MILSCSHPANGITNCHSPQARKAGCAQVSKHFGKVGV